MSDVPDSPITPATTDAAALSPRRSVIWIIAQSLSRILTTLFFGLRVHGLRNVPRTGPALILANHQSYVDPVLIGAQLSRPVSYMAKRELFEHGPFAWLIRSLHAFPVRQGTGDIAAIREMLRRLGMGFLTNIFPEGSRSKDGRLQPLQSGVSLIIRKARVPVIPAAIDGAFDAWPIHGKRIRFVPIDLMFGPPLKLWDMPSEQIMQTLQQTLARMIEEVKAKRRAAGRAV